MIKRLSEILSHCYNSLNTLHIHKLDILELKVDNLI